MLMILLSIPVGLSVIVQSRITLCVAIFSLRTITQFMQRCGTVVNHIMLHRPNNNSVIPNQCKNYDSTVPKEILCRIKGRSVGRSSSLNGLNEETKIAAR